MNPGGSTRRRCLWMSASRESNKTSFEQRRVCELPTSHMVVSEIQHIEGDISANRLLQHYLRISDEAARVYRVLSRLAPIAVERAS